MILINAKRKGYVICVVINELYRTSIHMRIQPHENCISHVGLVSVQHECIPQAILSMDVLCQAKSGMGKTAVFVLATLQQLEPVDGQVSQFP